MEEPFFSYGSALGHESIIMFGTLKYRMKMKNQFDILFY